jgi:sterol desaturase/sphingolipid hydroxylase (fatty acid hydroxylase superfamily)
MMPADPRTWVTLATMAALPVLLLLEARALRARSAAFDAREALRNLAMGLVAQGAMLAAAALLIGPVFAWVHRHRLFEVPSGPAAAIAAFVLLDLCFYWMHRTTHRTRWFWCAHVTHHSCERMNLSVAIRVNVFGPFNGHWLFYALPIAVGFDPAGVGLALAVDLAWQQFLHTTLVPRLHPALEWLFNTPSHHRVHHAANARYVDANFGGILIVWDRLFGTFRAERADEPVVYGLARPLRRQGAWSAWTHEYRALFDELRATPAWRRRLALLWRAPG